MLRTRRVGITAAAVIGAVASLFAAGPLPRLNVCQAIEQAQKLSGRYVAVHGYVGSDGIEHTDLKSDACPGKAITLWVTDAAAKNDRGLKLVQAALYCPPFGTRGGKEISGDFEGQFERTPGPMPRLRLRVAKVTHLRLYIRDCAILRPVPPPGAARH